MRCGMPLSPRLGLGEDAKCSCRVHGAEGPRPHLFETAFDPNDIGDSGDRNAKNPRPAGARRGEVEGGNAQEGHVHGCRTILKLSYNRSIRAVCVSFMMLCRPV